MNRTCTLTFLVLTATLLGCSSENEADAPEPSSLVDGGLVDGGSDGATDATVTDAKQQRDTGGEDALDAAPTDCVAEPGPDVPDDDFRDTNCDGFDGDVSRAIFVAPDGSDDASGTMQEPLRTIGKGIETAVKTKSDVYICNAQYDENLLVQQVGVNLYGGYDCANGWQRTAEPAVVAPASGIPLTARNLPTEFRIYRMRFVAPDATGESGSSVAALFDGVPGAVAERSEFEAGNAKHGKDAMAPLGIPTPPKGANGASQPAVDCTVKAPPAACSSLTEASGGAAQPPLSSTQCSIGGFGGDSQYQKASDCFYKAISSQNVAGIAGCELCQNAENNGYFVGVWCFGELGAKGQPPGGSGGGPLLGAQPGADGEQGPAGVPGQQGYGTVDPSGYVPSNAGRHGSRGNDGLPGGGGVGGASLYSIGVSAFSVVAGGGGGQGGSGGCGGPLGRSGTAGGGSVAVLLFDSSITVRRCILTTASGGDGGKGSKGASGQPGGQPGVGGTGTVLPDISVVFLSDGRKGASGGTGGPGGDGGSGAGGPSMGIFGKTSTVSLSETDVYLGKGGAGGTAASTGGLDGADGLVTDVLLLDGNDEPVTN